MNDELRAALESAVTEEQKKAVFEKFKSEISKLSEEELKKVVGGCEPEAGIGDGNADGTTDDNTVWGGPWW